MYEYDETEDAWAVMPTALHHARSSFAAVALPAGLPRSSNLGGGNGGSGGGCRGPGAPPAYAFYDDTEA